MENVGNWVPQVFYDLIGRIIPGAMLCIVALVAFEGPLAMRDLLTTTTTTTTVGGTTTVTTVDSISASFLLFIGFIISYVVGSLLGGIAAATRRSFWRRQKSDLTNKKDNDASYVYDFIQYHRPTIGARLAKLSAERHMCRVITVGAVLLGVLYAIAPPVGYRDIEFWIVETSLAIMGISALFLRRHISSKSRELMSNNWRLINQEIE